MGERRSRVSPIVYRTHLDHDLRDDVFLFAILLIPSNKIAIHAKRKTIMDHDMQLLRDLWKSIAPESAIGKESKDSKAQKAVWQARERASMHRRVTDMKERVRSYRANGIIPSQKLSAGEKGFCRKNDINFS